MSKKYENDLCDFGGDNVIFYSTDEQLFKEFAQDPNCVRSEGYTRDGGFLAGDCYFPRKYKRNLEKRLKRRGLIK